MFRGPQPYFEDLEKLKSHGLNSVVNLRSESRESEIFCRELGLGYLHVPVEDWGVPEVEQVRRFLDFVKGPTRPQVLVHCFQGIGRTGVFVTCYRLSLGMELDEAIEISDQETPALGMSASQRQWLKEFSPGFRD